MTIMSQQTGTAAGPAERLAKWAPLAVILCGTFIYVLDFFVVNVALPDIQRSLRASTTAIEWLVSGYALTSACLLVTGDGPIREYYLVGSADTDDERQHRTEVCWPVFLTGVKEA
jgi:hypothetical protein